MRTDLVITDMQQTPRQSDCPGGLFFHGGHSTPYRFSYSPSLFITLIASDDLVVMIARTLFVCGISGLPQPTALAQATRRCYLPNGVKYHYEQGIALILVLNAGRATFGGVICQVRNLLRSFCEGIDLIFS